MEESYLECGLPKYLKLSIDNYKKGLEKIRLHEKYLHMDCDFCELQSSINSAEVDEEITSEQANFLRSKYLYD